MKSALFALTASSLLGSALSFHSGHHLFHKRNVAPKLPPLENGCCKAVVTVTVFADAPEATKQAKVVDTVSLPETSGQQAKPQEPAKPVEAQKAPSAGVAVNGNKWGITYTPYNPDGGCRDAGAVKEDLLAIKAKGFTTVRMYGTDCNGLSSVGAAARAAGLKMIVGIFIKSSGIEGARSQIGDIVNWGNAGNWDLVVMVVVGNEAIFAGFCDGPSLAKFISDTKGALTAAGQGGIPVTTAEVVSTLGANKAHLCPVIDVVGANIHAYFDGKVEAKNAGSFVQSQLDQVASFCPGKPYYNLETGWPSAGGNKGASIADPASQRAAIEDILSKVGGKSIVFSFKNDLWKPAGIEQNFGCSQLF